MKTKLEKITGNGFLRNILIEKKKIYFVDYPNQADIKIYFVDYENQAGWRNKEKKHLMY
jgi:hypothetical protein